MASKSKKRNVEPLRWPILALRLTAMWGNYNPAMMAPIGAWVYLVLLVIVVAPNGFYTFQSLSVPAVVEGLLLFLTCVMATIKVFTIARGSAKISQMQYFLKNDLQCLERVVEKEANEVNQESLSTSGRFCQLYFTAQLQMILIAFCNIMYNVSLPRGQRQLPYLVPEFILRNDLIFSSYSALLLAAQFFYILGVGAFDTLFVCLCTQISGKTCILGHMFTRIASEHQEQRGAVAAKPERRLAVWDSYDANRAVRNSDMAVEMEKCVLYHQRLIRMRDDVEDLFARSAFYALMYFGLALGAPAVRILFDKNASLSSMVYFTGLVSSTLIQLAVLCWFGDKVAESSEQVRDTAFCTYRQGMNSRTRTLLLMIILRTQKPLYLTADRIAYFTVYLLMTVLRRSHSLYSAVINFI